MQIVVATVNESSSLAGLSHFAERLYWRMAGVADEWGRLSGDPEKVRASCLARVECSTAEVETAIEELIRAGRVEVYIESGTWTTQLVDHEHYLPGEVRRLRGLRNRQSRWPHKTPASDVRHVASMQDACVRVREGACENGRTLDTSSLVQLHEVESAAAPRDAVEDIYNHWRTERGKSHGRYDTISVARRKKIAARLREFSVDELKQAIAAVALDPWEERPRHDDLLVILRSREQVERFLAFTERSPSQPGSADQAELEEYRRRYVRA